MNNRLFSFPLLLLFATILFVETKEPTFVIIKTKEGKLIIIREEKQDIKGKELSLAFIQGKIPQGYHIKQESHKDLFKRIWHKHKQSLFLNGLALAVLGIAHTQANKKTDSFQSNVPQRTRGRSISDPTPRSTRTIDYHDSPPFFSDLCYSGIITISTKQLHELYEICIDLFEGRQPKLVADEIQNNEPTDE